jgi:hypothetical protein
MIVGFATEDRVVDDSIVTFEIARVGYWPWSLDEKIEMRLVHIFEMRDGKISRELVFDMGRPAQEGRKESSEAVGEHS